ncbi:MAG: hypothetical protein WEB58_02230, partial [Planctomycetaceae bacterium]
TTSVLAFLALLYMITSRETCLSLAADLGHSPQIFADGRRLKSRISREVTDQSEQCSQLANLTDLSAFGIKHFTRRAQILTISSTGVMLEFLKTIHPVGGGRGIRAGLEPSARQVLPVFVTPLLTEMHQSGYQSRPVDTIAVRRGQHLSFISHPTHQNALHTSSRRFCAPSDRSRRLLVIDPPPPSVSADRSRIPHVRPPLHSSRIFTHRSQLIAFTN